MIFTFGLTRDIQYACVLFEQQLNERLAISGEFRLVCPTQFLVQNLKRGASALCKDRDAFAIWYKQPGLAAIK
jgi:hypothetical protein